MKKTKIITTSIILSSLCLLILWWCNQKQTTPWMILDEIVQLRQSKQSELDKIKLIDEQIATKVEKMNKLQYSWLEYMGLISEKQAPQKTWIVTQGLSGQYIK